MAQAQPAENFNGITLKSLLENPSLLLPPPSYQQNDEKKEKEKGDDWFYSNETADMAAAFLGPTLWDKTLSYENDLKLEYMDIDEFLKENGIQFNESQENSKEEILPASPDSSVGAAVPPSDIYPDKRHHQSPQKQQSPQQQHSPQQQQSPQQQHSPLMSPINLSMQCADERLSPPPRLLSPPGQTGSISPPREPSPVSIDVDFDLGDSDVALATAPGQDQYDPKKRIFSEEELKPQPMVKKSRKIYVPEDLKDDKYWERRRKNNIAAKRSRDARRIKENQIVIRASYLEKENGVLKDQVMDLKHENVGLKKLVASFEKQLKELKSL